MQLPYIQTEGVLTMIQTKWRSILNPFLANPSLQSIILKDIALINGTTTINHLLGRTLTGWRIIRINAAATIYDKQATNQSPDLTLVLVSNAACTVSLEVF